jgi:hypothetical protein
MRFAWTFCVALFLTIGVESAHAFALLGPYAPWMTVQLGYHDSYDIGGPMNIGEGYRWNVPVITYGYDKSFINYFGTNGIAAVENAIKILNDLPPASQIVVTNYPLGPGHNNATASQDNLFDLKSAALVSLLEQMGLGRPITSVYTIHDLTETNGVLSACDVITRNFDPVSFTPSSYINATYCPGYDLLLDGERLSPVFLPLTVTDPIHIASAVAYWTGDYMNDSVANNEPDKTFFNGYGLNSGDYFLGLTMDDVGGLCYLLNTNNFALESVISGVRGLGNTTNYVNRTLRPGVDKITFQQLSYDSSAGQFIAITNEYTDTYIANGMEEAQALERVITHPDILFTAEYDGINYVSMTGTTNWINNGTPGSDGPGVIQPPIAINFNQTGPSLGYGSSSNPVQYPVLPIWGSFNGTTNAPIIYPVSQANAILTTFHFALFSGSFYDTDPQTYYSWSLQGVPNTLFSLQTSTNLTDWLTIGTITNIGGTFTYVDQVYTNTPQRYFRTVSQ